MFSLEQRNHLLDAGEVSRFDNKKHRVNKFKYEDYTSALLSTGNMSESFYLRKNPFNSNSEKKADGVGKSTPFRPTNTVKPNSDATKLQLSNEDARKKILYTTTKNSNALL